MPNRVTSAVLVEDSHKVARDMPQSPRAAETKREQSARCASFPVRCAEAIKKNVVSGQAVFKRLNDISAIHVGDKALRKPGCAYGCKARQTILGPKSGAADANIDHIGDKPYANCRSARTG